MIGIIVFLVIIIGVLYAISKKYLKLNTLNIPLVNQSVTKWYKEQGYPPDFIQFIGEIMSEQINSISDFLNVYNKTFILKIDPQITSFVKDAYTSINEEFGTTYAVNTNDNVTAQVIEFYKTFINTLYNFLYDTLGTSFSPQASPAASLF